MRARRRSRGKPALLLIILLALVALILFRYVFVVRNVEIGGDRQVSDETVTRAASIDFGSSIFFVDEAWIRAGVNALGSVRLDGVEIRYPNTILLSVSQRARKAMLLHMGDIRVLDEECCVVESAPTVPDTDLIYVNGMTVTSYTPGVPLQAGAGQVEAYCAIMRALDESAANGYVSEIELSDVNDLRLITRSGITVRLGDSENMSNKIAWMRSAVADLEQRGEGGGSLDVRSGTKADYSRTGPEAAAE